MSTPIIKSNADYVNAWLQDIAEGFAFTETTEGGTLGKNCAHIIAYGIAKRSISDQRGASRTWPALNAKYKAWKEKKYHVGLTGVRTGQMLSMESLLGTVSISTDQVEILYGTAQAPTRSMASSYISTQDQEITDIEKAYFFSEHRPFFEVDDQISDEVFDFIEETLEDYLKRA